MFFCWLKVVFVLLTVAFSAKQDCTYTSDGFSIENVGSSGQFKYFGNDTNGFWKLKMDQLYEEDSEGNISSNRKVTSWASQDYSLSCGDCSFNVSLSNGSIVAETFPCSIYNATLDIAGTDVVFTMITALFDNDTVICNNIVNNECEGVQIEGPGMKFNIIIDNWPIITNNVLKFCVTVTTSQNGNSDENDQIETENEDNTLEISWDNGWSLNSPEIASIQSHADGTQISSNVDISVSNKSSSNTDICFTFYNLTADHKLIYDPTVNDGDNSSSSSFNSVKNLFFSIILFNFFIIFHY